MPVITLIGEKVDPNISEFSYGFAITDELINHRNVRIRSAPTFLSTYQEGQPDGGYDVRLDKLFGIPLFLQFKLSHYLCRSNAREIKEGKFRSPYYRMYLRPLRHSNQHTMLLELESNGNDVYYCAPAFHTPDELNYAYLNHEVKDRSVWIRPSRIGHLPDDETHYVAFQMNGRRYVCSKETKILDTPVDFKQFIDDIVNKIKEKGQFALKPKNLEKLADFMSKVSEKKREIIPEKKRNTDEILRSRKPIKRIAFYSIVYFDCQLYIASLRETEDRGPRAAGL